MSTGLGALAVGALSDRIGRGPTFNMSRAVSAELAWYDPSEVAFLVSVP